MIYYHTELKCCPVFDVVCIDAQLDEFHDHKVVPSFPLP